MPKTFLTAEWKNLLMANYAIDPGVLLPYLPHRTELDSFGGKHYVSLVGFLFANTRLLGLSIPFHRTFEEVNLRFYVRYKCGKEWRRGVVFLREIVPRRAISFVANTLYGERYTTHAMKHHWKVQEDTLAVEYAWKVDGDWNHLKALAERDAAPLQPGSEEAFITEHYWGYTSVDHQCTGTYQVQHPQWRVHRVVRYDIHCSAEKLYGPAFVEALRAEPSSVFLAQGSPVTVFKGEKILADHG